jgi:hypothetical protein
MASTGREERRARERKYTKQQREEEERKSHEAEAQRLEEGVPVNPPSSQ